MKRVIGVLVFLSSLTAHLVYAQEKRDTLKVVELAPVSISAQRDYPHRLPAVQGTYLWAGKKNEVIDLQYEDVNIAEKTARQIFAKIPGIFVYDMDGTGNQMNISTRGLDPHRGWEFNIRKNGIMTNSDIYGYPASHYSLPMEAVERIELVRGTGALQYGAQFGGMLNYVVKQPDTTRAIGLETINTVGSYGLVSSYNSIGGKSGKWQYMGYFSKRVSQGYRDNSHSNYDGQSVIVSYVASEKVKLTAELARSNYLYQIPGPLTDLMFKENPRKATRSRNYFNPEIYVPSFTFEYALGKHTSMRWTISAVLGERRSVMFDKPATTPDAIDAGTLQQAPRQVDIDQFNSYTSELRFLHEYRLGNLASVLSAGAQYIHNDLHRRQLGKGTTGSDFDLSLTQATWGRDMHLKSQNIAFFAENMFRLTPHLFVSPGVRLEAGASNMTGTITYLPHEQVPNRIQHRFPLFGIHAGYQVDDSKNFYFGWSQAYRPVIFKDIVPGSVFERTDKNLKDAKGYNVELGYRGSTGRLKWDVGVFRVQYNNRLGNQIIQDTIIFRTNIGHSVTNGVELFAQYVFNITPLVYCQIFTSTAYMDARYSNASLRAGNENVDIDNNKVESVPEWITRNGVNLRYKKLSLSALYSYTGETFADPLNTRQASATGSVGLVPAYWLLDLNASYRISNRVIMRASLNNLTDNQYFTKRPSFYPGPGVWPSDGRTANVTLAVKM